MKGLFDTNILIDYLAGIELAREEIERFPNPMISPITWMEVMVGTDAENDQIVRAFLAGFRQQPIDGEVADAAVSLRKFRRIRLPDAIIWASARVSDALLITRNRRDFPADDPGIRIPYDL